MPQIRRAADRRRRVMYQSHVSPAEPSTPAERRAAEQLRAARQPAQAFGSRVHQHLRGRWFSLVPVSGFAMAMTAAAVLLISTLLAVLHHIAMTWPAIAYRPELARPLSIDRPDSFAAWWMTVLLLLSAGACRLVYGLRSHRRDDYRGHYQLWQLTLVVLLLASVHSTVDLVAWLGAGMDLIVGDRAVLSGANWLRIVLDVGGIILAMRLIVEVYRCRPALAGMLCAGAWIGLAEAATWRVITVESASAVTLVIAAPMLGWSCFLVASTFYLRSMYRQIRNIPAAPPLRVRINQWIESRRQPADDDTDLEFFQQQPEPLSVVRPVARPAAASQVTDAAPNRPSAVAEGTQGTRNDRTQRPDRRAAAEGATDQVEAPEDGKPKRRWFGLRAAKPAAEPAESVAEPAEVPTPTKKSWFSLRLRPQKVGGTNLVDEPAQKVGGTNRVEAGEDGQQPAGDPDQTAKTKKRWFGLWRRKPAVTDESLAAAGEDSSPKDDERPRRLGPLAARAKGLFSGASRPSQKPDAALANGNDEGADSDDSDDIDPDGIDWESLNKSERRRMRKQIKRSGRAA